MSSLHNIEKWNVRFLPFESVTLVSAISLGNQSVTKTDYREADQSCLENLRVHLYLSSSISAIRSKFKHCLII